MVERTGPNLNEFHNRFYLLELQVPFLSQADTLFVFSIWSEKYRVLAQSRSSL